MSRLSISFEPLRIPRHAGPDAKPVSRDAEHGDAQR
jgi:hypothetical protein